MTQAIDEVGGTRGAARLANQMHQMMVEMQQATDTQARHDAMDGYKQMETQLANKQQQAAQQLGNAQPGQAVGASAHGPAAARQGVMEGRNGLLNTLGDLLISAAELAQHLGKFSANNLTQQLNNHLGGSFDPNGMFGGGDEQARGGAGGGAGVGQQWTAPSVTLIAAPQGAEGGAFGKGSQAGHNPFGPQPQPELHGNASTRGGARAGRKGFGQFSGVAPQDNTPLTPQEGDEMAMGVGHRLMAELGLTKEQAAGLVGHLYHKSAGMNSNVGGSAGGRASATFGMPVQGRVGYGWGQWDSADYLAFCKERQLDCRSPEANYQFLVHRLQGDGSGTLQALKKAGGVEEAAMACLEAGEAISELESPDEVPSPLAAARHVHSLL